MMMVPCVSCWQLVMEIVKLVGIMISVIGQPPTILAPDIMIMIINTVVVLWLPNDVTLVGIVNDVIPVDANAPPPVCSISINNW